MRRIPYLSILFILLFSANCGSQIQKVDLNSCSKISGVPGPEDLDLLKVDGKPFLIVSVHNRRDMSSVGWLSYIDLSLPTNKQLPVIIKSNYPANFRPHGISYAKVNGKDTLAVISHTLIQESPHSIELFERKNMDEWIHVKTLQDPYLTAPNDLFLNERGEIFASNDRGPENKLMQYVNMILNHGTADIAFYDGDKFQELNHKVVLGNGIFVRMEKGEEILYRSVFSEKSISVFKVIRVNNQVSLLFQRKIDIKSGADNIMQDEKGNLWVAGHPSTIEFLKHASNKEKIAPSQVFKIDTSTDKVELVYSNDGDQISAASTALPNGDRIFISQVFEDFLLTCTRP